MGAGGSCATGEIDENGMNDPTSRTATEQPLTVTERVCYSLFNGADYLLKNIIGKYMFFFYTTSFAINPLWIAIGQPLVKLLDVRGSERHVINQTHARHILVKTNEVVSGNDARSRLRVLRARILNGSDFGELARANSDDPGSAVKGGDLGWLSPGDTIPAFEKTMDRLGDDEISEPFETQFGWHIVQVLGRRDRDSTQEVQRAKAAEELRRRKVEEELQAWFRQIRDEAYIEYRLEE